MITLILIFIAGLSNGIMDLVSFHFDKVPKFMKTFDDFWNPKISWKKKWKKNKVHNIVVFEERFWGSSRWFVFITDGWHLMKEIMLSSISLAFAINSGLILFDYNFNNIFLSYLIIRIIFGLGFKITYK